MKHVYQAIVAAPVFLLWSIARLLPVPWASAFGGLAAGLIGPRHPKHQKVVRNLRVAFPSLDERDLARLVRGVWRNAGAVLGELPHTRRIARTRVEIEMAPSVRALIDAGTPVLFVSAHLANWEIITFVLADLAGPMTFVYTPDGNPFIARLVQRYRRYPNCEYVTKEGAVRNMFRAGERKRSIATMTDIRVDGGALLPLFGVDAATTTAPARVAQRIGYPVVPVHSRRLPGTRFRVEIGAPLGGATNDAAEVMTQFNRLLESWIRECPTQWWCMKRRWPTP